MINITDTYLQVLQKDKTGLAGLINLFIRDVRKRLIDLWKVINKAIVEENCFNLSNYELSSPGYKKFALPTNEKKIEEFMAWLKLMQKKSILEVKEIYSPGRVKSMPWSNYYIEAAYMKGIEKARNQLKKLNKEIPSIEATGGIQAAINAPIHADRLALLFTQSYSYLQGITEQMDLFISYVLADGLARGLHPYEIAKQIKSIILSSAAKNENIKISYLDAETRAKKICRTELVRAHAEAQLNEYESWKFYEVILDVELVTTTDPCPKCAELSNKIYTIEEARGLIPVHPNCRCAWVPVKH